MKRRISLLTAALMLIVVLMSAMPSTLLLAETRSAPAGYVEHEYESLRAFLEQTNAQGIKNGVKLSSYYNPDDPTTWGGVFWENVNGTNYVQQILFSSYWEERELVGSIEIHDFEELEVFGCSTNLIDSVIIDNCPRLDELNVSINQLTEFVVTDCPSLRLIWCEENNISELDFSTVPSLRQLHCYSNPYTELDLSHNPALVFLYCHDTEINSLDVSKNTLLQELRCHNTNITELDVSNNLDLTELYCQGTGITELDVSNNTYLAELYCYETGLTNLDLSANANIVSLSCYGNELTKVDWDCVYPYALSVDLIAEGSGYVGTKHEVQYLGSNYWANYIYAVCEPAPGAEFLGWYDVLGNCVSTQTSFLIGDVPEIGNVYYTARFTTSDQPVPGDASGDMDDDGIVTVQDALVAMRGGMGLVNLSPAQIEAGDLDGDGSISVADATMIMRAALGL